MSLHSPFQFHPIPAELLPGTGRCLMQTAAWNQGWLYLGVTSYPADAYQPGSAVLLRHRLRASSWESLYTSPVESRWIIQAGQARRFPLELGWQTLTVLPGATQPTPALYALRLGLRTSALLHSGDGVHFEALPNPAPDAGHGPFIALRGFSNQAFAIPASAAHDTGREGPQIWVSADPFSQPWRPACEPGFGHAGNRTLDGLQVFNGQLYAAASNPTNGFQLWKTAARSPLPLTWEPVLIEGAQRYTLNPHIETMTVFKDALYLGSRSPSPDPNWEFATSSAEIIRVLPDGRWELVMGTPRFSPVGLQIPLSTHGPGFDDPHHRRIACLVGTPDALYATVDQDEDLPEADSKLASIPFQLWKTRDGEDWQVIPPDVFGQPGVTRLRVLQPTPHGLVVAGDWDLSRHPEAQPGIWLEQLR
ncbi:MAG: hypothetical protein KDJ28_13615 [Candidatus Competibacteraceae bacterium]|nr:hypothetical protein [Candidatus Competibacteraceae bacterium]